MASVPLLSDRDKSESPVRHADPQKSLAARRFLDAKDLASCIASIEAIPTRTIFFEEASHVALITELDYVIETVQRYSSQMSHANSEQQVVHLLSRLESVLTASPGLPAKALLMLAEEIEAKIPVRTGADEVLQYAQALKEMAKSTVTVGGVDLTLEDCARCKADRANMLLVAANKVSAYDGADPERLKADVHLRAVTVRGRFYGTWADDPERQPSMLHWFGKGCDRLMSAGYYEILCCGDGLHTVLTGSRPESKAALHWTALGTAACRFMGAFDIPECKFRSTNMHYSILEDASGVVIPQFLFKLYTLKGVLEGQIKTVDAMKGKVLAGLVSVAVAGGQIVAKYISSMLEDESAK